MHRAPWSLALAVLASSCGSGGGGGDVDAAPTSSPFGLDTRPSNTTCLAKQRPPLDINAKLQPLWNGVTFNQPLYMTQAPGDNTTWYVVEKSGSGATPNLAKVRAVPVDATSNAQVRDFAAVTVNATNEGGLLGMAFHPDWPSKREAYLSFTRTFDDTKSDPAPVCTTPRTSAFTSVIARYQSSNGMSLDGPADEILKVGQPFTNHNGGNIQFGRDGMLFLGLGDGGDANDTCGMAQNLTSPLGKMLRIDINAPAGMYKIPTDNPFVDNATARKEIWAYGLRNPWRWSFDRASGELWVGDVGQNTFEEIDRVVKGGNYGWNPCEGFHRRGNTTALCNIGGLIDPIVEHGRTEAASITGGYVYHGTAMPSLVGTYIYGDYATGNIWALTFNASNKATPALMAMGVSGLASFAQGNDGELYAIQLSGVISKLVPGGAPQPDNFPKLLSATGCVDPADPTKPAAGMIPYEVNSPLWSDGAEKQRYLGLPDGAAITINGDGDWDLPIGSVAMKKFSVGGKLVETRLFMRHDDGVWAGYTYEWNDDGKDATLLAGSKLKALGGTGAWAYPSRSQCIQCHSIAAGGTLGLDTAQLNRDAVYPSTNRKANQLATLDHIGMFSAPLAQAPEAAPRLSDPAGSDPVEARARAYLHANCSHCHRPMGGGQGMMDLRYTQSLHDTNTCNAANTQGPVNGAAKIVLPGDPQHSILSARLHATDSKRMPPVAVSVTDEAGAKVIDDWITALTTCP